MKSRISTLLVAAFFLMQLDAQAFFYNFPGFLKRYEMGYNYSIATARYKSTESIVEPNTGKVFNSVQDKMVTSKLGYGGFVGTSIPLKQTGQSTALHLGIGFNYNIYMWDYEVPMFDNFYYDESGNPIGTNYSKTFGISSMTAHMALPISADFKFGAEATLDRSKRWTGTLGLGVYPNGNLTMDFNDVGYGFGVSPFAKAEIGIKAGIIMKLRATYIYGNIPYFSTQANMFGISEMTAKSELIGQHNINFSFIIMPFSWTWDMGGWWNKHH